MSDITYSLKGFVGYGALADNNLNTVAAAGELSAYARTYAKDRGIYGTGTGTSPETSVDLTVFSSKRAADNTDVPVPSAYSAFLLTMSTWVYTQALNGSNTNDPEVLRQAILAEFNGKVTDVTVGAMILVNGIYLPASIIFNLKPDGLGVTWDSAVRAYLDVSRVKLWFSDDRFRREYDEYEIEFIAPLENLDDFFLASSAVKSKTDLLTVPLLMEKVRDIADQKPYTILRTEAFDYHDPLATDNVISTNWTFLIYGAGGDNIDAIKEALINWILKNSSHTREEWAVLFPDIFTSTEFIVTPLWSQYAVENMTVQAGVYSPLVNLQQALLVSRTSAIGTGYSQEHIDRNTTVTGIPFKSIAMTICGGPENRNGKSRFEDYFADYMNVSSTSSDFGRMSQLTQGLVLLLEQMLSIAEDMTEYSDIPNEMTRLTRTASDSRSFLYLVKSYNNIQFLVAAGKSVHRYFPAVTYKTLGLTNNGVDGVTTLPHGYSEDAYTTTFVGVGGTGIYTYELVNNNQTVISTQSIDPITGVYSATFESSGGDATVSVKVKDSSGAYKVVDFSLHVIQGAPQS